MIRPAVFVSLALGLVGCAEQEAETDRASSESGTASSSITFNALTGNALTGNALTGNALTGNALTGNALTGNALTGNALTGNALTGNALTGNALTGNGLTNGQLNRELFRYMYSCAMPAGSRITRVIDGKTYTFDGAIGLAPNWGLTPTPEHPEYGKCDVTCQRWITACLLARTNAFGVPVPISIRGGNPSIANASRAEQQMFPLREGSYYGNIFGGDTGVFDKFGCTGPTSNDPAQTARLCSNGGTDGGLGNPCGITIAADECFVPAAEKIADPVFGVPGQACTKEAASGEISGCATPTNQSMDEVITVFLKQPLRRAGNGVCENGETQFTTADCSSGWAVGSSDPTLLDPTGGIANTNAGYVIAGRTTGKDNFPLLDGAAPSESGFFLRKVERADGAPLWSIRIGSGSITPTVIKADASFNIYVAGFYLGTASFGGPNLTAAAGREAFVAKYDQTGRYLWAVGVPSQLRPSRMIFDPEGNLMVAGGGAEDVSEYRQLSVADGSTVGTPLVRFGEVPRGVMFDSNKNLLVSDLEGTALYLPNPSHTPWPDPSWTRGASSSLDSPELDESGDLALAPPLAFQPVPTTQQSAYLVRKNLIRRFHYDTTTVVTEWEHAMAAEPGQRTLAGDTSLDTEPDLSPRVAVGLDGHVVVGGNYTQRFILANNVFSTGTTDSFARGFLVKLDELGTVLWTKEFSTPINSRMTGFALDNQDGIAVTGRYQGNVIIDGFGINAPRQSAKVTSSEMYIARVRDHVIGREANDLAGGAIHVPTTGDGFHVEYFDRADFTDSVASVTDPTASFFSVLFPPVPGMGATNYSIWWTGVIDSDVTEPVTFDVVSDGAVVVTLDGQAIITRAAGTPQTERTQRIVNMVAGQRYDIEVTYVHTSGIARMQLFWSSEHQARQIVPSQAVTSERVRRYSGQTVDGIGVRLNDDYHASCGGGATGPDAVYTFTLTEPTRVTVDTGDSFDSVLYLLDGSTTAGEVACDAQEGRASLDETLGPGAYLVVIDGQAGQGGSYDLDFSFAPAKANDTEADAVFVSDTNNGGRFYGTTTGYSDGSAASCGGGGGAPDAVYKLVLTTPRDLHVDTNGSDFDTVLSIRGITGELACHDNNDDEDKTSTIDIALVPGVYYVYVDGKGGASGDYRADFRLSTNLPPNADAGADQTRTCRDVRLDGSGSFDHNGDPLAFRWSENGAPLATGESPNVRLGVGPHLLDLVVDDGRLTAADSVAVTIVGDTTKPTVATPANIAVIASSATGNLITYLTPTASDDCDSNLAVTCAPPSGSRFTLGSTKVTCSARDDAGNVGTSSFDVAVTLSASKLLAPVNTDGSSVFKKNSTIPLKFVLTGASAGITDLVARVFVAKISNNVIGSDIEAVSTSTASTGNVFRYDAGQYVFNLGTKSLTVGTYQIRIDLGDGVSRTVLVSLN